MSEGLRERLEVAVGVAVQRLHAVGGGSIAAACRVELTDGRRLFAKVTQGGTCVQEANGLRALARAAALATPEVLYVEPDLLVLSWVEQGPRGADFGALLGRGLAALHRHCGSAYGFDEDNWIGATPQPNAVGEGCDDWAAFFWEHRLEHQIGLLVGGGYEGQRWLPKLRGLEQRVAQWLPSTPPASLLHGDLWSGNVLAGVEGRPWIIDPAVYYGHREADLGMAAWLGHFGPGFWQAYDEAYPREPGADERIALYKLYHVLNHINLFGAGYAAEAASILRQLS